MTRYGMVQTSAAGAPPAATDLTASLVMIGTGTIARGRVAGRQSYPHVQRRGLSTLMSAILSGGRAIADISRTPKSP